MPDIFDQVATPAAPPSGGDIFDQVADTAAAKTPDIDYSHPAGATGPLPTPAAHPAVDMKAGPSLTPDLEQQVDQSVRNQARRTGGGAGDQIVGGVKDITKSAAMDFENSGGNPFAPNLTGDAAKQRTNLALGGAAKLIAGGGSTLIAVDAPQILEIGSAAFTGDATAKLALAKIAASVGAGAGASVAGGAAADKLNLSPEAKSLVQSVSFFLPSLFGIAAGKAGFKGGVGLDSEGNVGAGVETPGGTKVAVRAGNGGVEGGVQRPGSPFPTTVRVGRPAPPPDAAQVLNSETSDLGTNAIMRAATKEAQARTMVAGGPPPPPPGPPMPDQMKDGVISQQIVSNIAQAVHIAPAEQHPQLLMEAHGKLSEYIEKQGRIIGPDGKLQLAETPQQAAKLAQNIINNEVDRQSQAKEDAAKQQSEVAKQQEKATADATKEAEKAKADAEKPGENGEPSPADQQFQRAKTIIEGTTPKPGQHLDETIMRNLAVDRPTAHALIDRYAKEAGEAQLPTVGSKKEPVVEESRATVDAQVGALKRGDINVVMLPEGSKYRPATPDGMKLMAVRGDAPGAGYYIYDPTKIQAATIREAAKAGTHGDLLGHVQPKAELDPAKPTVVVQAQDKAGTPIQDSEVHPERVQAQVAAMQERHPDAHVVVRPTHQVIAERVAGHGDIFDEVDHPANDYAKSAETEPAKEVGKSEEKETTVAEKTKEQEAADSQRRAASAAPETSDEVKTKADDHLKDIDKAASNYIEKNTSGGTLTVSSDAAREMLPGYGTPAERTQNTLVLGPASSKLADAAWEKAIEEGPTDAKPGVEFLTGSPGSGKSSSVIDNDLADSKFKVVSEGMMDNYDRSAARIQQAIDAGFIPSLRLIYAIDPKTTLRRAVARAMEHGRPVTVKLMSRLYVEIPKTVERLAEHFGDKLGVQVFDNSRDGRGAKRSDIASAVAATGEYTVDTAREAMLDELAKLSSEGKVTPDLFRKFQGDLKASDTAAIGGHRGGEVAQAPERANREDQPRREGSRAVEPHTPLETSTDVEKQETPANKSLIKGKRVAFTGPNGVEREGIVSHVGERITRIGKYDVANKNIGEDRPELKPGQDGRVAISELHLDPKRFQYKVSGIGAEGVSDLLTGKKWNDKLSGAISAWRDPADGKIYVVNGHHRVTLAKQTGAKNLLVRLLDEPTAAAARATGALQNIADGRGTAIDAAKFLRDSGITMQDLEENGISMGEATAQNGVSLSRLDDRLFDMVVQGKMGPGRGIAIGRETDDPATQDAILKMIDKAEKRGVRVNDGTVEELARFAQTAPLRSETAASLFGDEEHTTSTALEKAEISAYAKRQMSTEKRVFGAVSTDARAKTLAAEGKNKIDAAGNAARATDAEQAMEVYDKLSSRRGPIDDILNRSAEELASAKPSETVAIKQQAYEDIRTAVSEALRGGKGSRAGGDEEAAGRGESEADSEQSELTLPGLEDDVARQKESAAEVKGENDKQGIESSLTTPKDNVSKAAGEMERNSPLFRDSEASGQGGLFGGDDTKFLHGGLGIAAGALKPLAQIKPVADAIAFLGDEAGRVAVSRDLHNRLYDMASQDNAAVLRVVQMLKDMPGTAKDQQAIYHHLEDPKSVALTDEQQDILDGYLTPLIYQAEHDFQVVTEGGVPLENYVHRQVRDRGGMIDRIMEKVKDKTPSNGIGGGRLTKTAPAQKHRTMMAIQDAKTGKRQVVSIKGGRVAVMKNGQAPEDIGGLRNGLTTVGAEVDERVAPFVKRVTELREEIAGAKDADRDEQLKDVQERIAELRKQMDTLSGVNTKSPGRKPDLFDKGAVFRSSEVTFNQRAEITKKLDPLLKREEALKAGTAPMLGKNVNKLIRAKAELKGAEAFRDAALNELPPETYADRAWKDKNGTLHKITQATTKEIEANTNVRYYQNAAASVAVNYLAMDKARRAYEFLEEFKKSPEFAAASHSIKSPGAIPKGWQATQLPQFRGYFFEPHIAEVLDAYAAKAAHNPGVLEQVGNFLRTSIFFNPLIHIPNLLNHWAVEKGASGFANPLNYPTITRAGVKAINAVIHQNADFLEALDHGAPLQSQQFETKQFADLFYKKMQDELGDPESSKTKELATALGMSPVNLVKAIYKFSGKATWYTNDIAFLQSTYEKQAKGMPLKDALSETAKHIPDYRLMTRIFDNPKLAKLMSNHNLTMFGAYHYGALKSYGQMAKSLTGFNWTDAGTKNDAGEPTNAAGRTESQEKMHGLDVLAMVAVVTFLVYPALDKLWKMFTGNDKAQMRRAGASTLIYNLSLLAKGEKTPEEVAESIATPAVQTKALAEMVLNRDLRTGQRIYNPHAPGKKLAEQVGRQVMRSVAPVSQGMDIAEGRTDVKRLMYSLVGVSFPLHGAEKIAAQITAERLSSLPPRDEDEIAHAIQRSRALHDHWSGDNSKLTTLLHGKDFTSKEKQKIRKDALLPPIVYAVRGMEYDDALRVYHAANQQEKHQLHALMSKKLARLLKEGKRPEEILGKGDDN